MTWGKGRRRRRNEMIAEELYACELELRRRELELTRRGESGAMAFKLAADRVHACWLDAASKLEDEYRRN